MPVAGPRVFLSHSIAFRLLWQLAFAAVVAALSCVDRPGVAELGLTELDAAGACFPAGRLEVAAGDEWKLTGDLRSLDVYGGGEQSAAFVTTHISVTGIYDGVTESGGEQVIVRGGVVEGTMEDRSDERGVPPAPALPFSNSTVSSIDQGPVLTIDWECHRNAWLSHVDVSEKRTPEKFRGPTKYQRIVEERILGSGMEVIVFKLKRDEPGLISSRFTTFVTSFGYDRETGRLVLREVSTFGIQEEETFGTFSSQELVAEDEPPALE